ncbi:XkdQ/YqbQ family protein [Anaeromicropila populeti]|uniref:YqbQ/XkdQ domain-containing protein n=1 Tax=Anaeromicropila populeti TaxID=37658 RepID=A0A1I6JI65_9FIRM|nr:hypothetical protein [Anaeromicropila populeti]SFR78611.1 hypothetical protein SAMN05661086_01708 [Anaeromicropila populeti]
MSMEFVVTIDKKIYEISQLVNKVSYTDKLNDGCSKLEFSYINNNLEIKNGSIVRFQYNNAKIFYGVVFRHERSDKNEVSVTAYDLLRYCKATDTIIIKEDTISTLTKKMCTYFGLPTGTITDTKYKLSTSVVDNKTWLDIIYSAISDTLLNKGKKYLLRDEYGTIAIRDVDELKLNLVLGDRSLVYGYEYEKSIDEDYYNYIKLIANNKPYVTRADLEAITEFGLLQYSETLDDKINIAQANAKADALLKLYNREAESLSIKCLGDTRIRAGSGFFAKIEDIGLEKYLFVKEVKHDFVPVHTMNLEVTL